MDKFSDIAKDYLADFEVLTEARKEFEKELANWWGDLSSKHLVNALMKVNKSEPNIWDNRNNPGESCYRVVENQDCFLWLGDPRNSELGCYTVGLYFVSQQVLKKFKSQEAFVKRFDALATELKIGDTSVLNWADTELATEAIPISPCDPDGTVRKVCDVASRYFRLVVEHHRIVSEDKAGKKAL